MATFEQRLERLEKSQKRYRFATVGLLCLMVAGVSMGQGNGVENIVCRSLMVVKEGGGVGIYLRNSNTGGVISVANDKDKETIMIGQNTYGDSLLKTYSRSGKNMVEFGGSDDQGGGVAIKNKTGERVVLLLADEYGNGVVGAYDRKGRGRTLESQ